jgi:hypothetical protein
MRIRTAGSDQVSLGIGSILTAVSGSVSDWQSLTAPQGMYVYALYRRSIAGLLTLLFLLGPHTLPATATLASPLQRGM